MLPPTRSLDLVRSSKLQQREARWYRYYAGFSGDFVAGVCEAYDIDSTTQLLDPWAGSGTSLGIAAGRGATVAGFDLNPAMVVVARGRLLAEDTLAAVEPLAADLQRHVQPALADPSDPLRQWFDPRTALLIRSLTNRIDEALMGDVTDWHDRVDKMSALCAFFYVALFETVTSSLRAYKSRNPTWLKRSKNLDGQVSVPSGELLETFAKSVRRLSAFVHTVRPISIAARDRSSVKESNSRSIPVHDDRFNFVLTSPPYLTRLDYVVAHAPELAILGAQFEDIDRLRRSMIGTPTITKGQSRQELSPAVAELLSAIRAHDSYAAKSYYEPNYRQYFEGMSASFAEIERVCVGGAEVVLVVQDSWFKSLRLDLAALTVDILGDRGWRATDRKDFLNVRTMTQLNTFAHANARSARPIESVLTFSTPIQLEQS